MEKHAGRRNVFLPDHLHVELRERAKREGTTITGELVHLVRLGRQWERFVEAGGTQAAAPDSN
jgi:hypothetical protein